MSNLACVVSPSTIETHYLSVQKKVDELHDVSTKYGWGLVKPDLPTVDMFHKFFRQRQNKGKILSATLSLWARNASYDLQVTFWELIKALKEKLLSQGFVLKLPDDFKINPQHLKPVFSGSEQRREAGIKLITVKHGVYHDPESEGGCRILDLWKESRSSQSLALMATELLTEIILNLDILTCSNAPIVIPGCNYRKGNVLQFVRSGNMIALEAFPAKNFIKGHTPYVFESLNY